MFEVIEVNADGPIGHIWLNRPERLNALSVQVLQELTAAAHWFDEQPEVRVVIIGGRGRAFCAGADITGFPMPNDPEFRHLADSGLRMANAVEGMRALTIARIHGWCIGGGLVLASVCDLRVAVEDARFSIPEIDLGIGLGWGGIERLVRDVGPAMAKELIITCREFDAPEARQIGFLNRTVEADALDSTVTELASAIAAKPSLPVVATKREVNIVGTQMVGLGRVGSDVDNLYAAFLDAECQASREAYIKSRSG